MDNHEFIIRELLEMGVDVTPGYPFAACFVDAADRVVVTACSACHISPIYTAEALAVHMLCTRYSARDGQALTLFTTALPEPVGLGAIHWANVMGYNINQVVYGASRETISQIWGGDKEVACSELIGQLKSSGIEITGPVIEDECRNVFEMGKGLIDGGECPVLSLELEDFWMAGDWLDLDIE